MPVRVLDFQATCPDLLDAARSGEAVDTFATELRRRRQEKQDQARDLAGDAELGDDASDSEIIFAAYVAAVEKRCGEALRSGEPVSFGLVMHTQKQVLLYAGWEQDDDRAFEKVRNERLTIAVVEKAAGASRGEGLEIVDVEKGRAFVVRRA